jgi:hypothetical protein
VGQETARDLLGVNDSDEPNAPRITRAVVDGWLARGYLEKVHVAVYRLAGTASIPGQKHYAAMRRAGDGARISGPSMLAFLGADGFDLMGDDRPFVLIPPGRRLVNVPFEWLAAPVPDGDAAVLNGSVPGVVPTRALIDAAGVVGRKRVRVAYDDLRRRGVVHQPGFVERAYQLLGKVPGAKVALEIVASGELDKESEGERWLSTIFLPTDPWPLWQVWVLDDVRVDALYPEARLALEYHGRKHHSIDSDRQRDAARAARLTREAQIEVFSVWYEDLDDRAALRARILDRRVDRIRRGVSPLRDFRLAQR